MWSRDMQIRVYLHDNSSRWSDWLLGEIFGVVGGFCCGFFVTAQIRRQIYCILNANLFMYSELYFQFGAVVTDGFINCFILYKYCSCAGSGLFCDAPYLLQSAQRNLTKEEDIRTYFTSMTSLCHRELEVIKIIINKITTSDIFFAEKRVNRNRLS